MNREQLEARIQKGDGCWEWQGAISKRGYGAVRWEGKTRPVHRIVWELEIGPIPEGMVIDHLCRNRRCCRLDHLRVTTHRENIIAGTGFGAVNAAKTHCPQGHEYTPENTYVYKQPKGNWGIQRVCRTCAIARVDRRRKQKRAMT